MIGRTISHYKILSQLGEGGMGVVYQAEDAKLERTVALKFVAPHLVQDPEVRKRFEREAKAAASLSHPNICTVHEIDEAEGKTFIAMPYVEGESLDEKIGHGPLKLEEALDIAQQIAKGLQAAHKKGIVHRDIKPQNVIVGDDGLATVMDFGLAQLTEASRLTKADQTMGTTAYMSPEQTGGSGTDHRTDIWSLGVVLYEMVTGRQPFKGDYDQAIMYSILNEEPEPPTAVRTGVPMALEVFVAKCLAKNPDERYGSASEIARDLGTLADKLRSGHSRVRIEDKASDAQPAPQTGKPALLYWVAAGGLALALAVVSAIHFTEGTVELTRQLRKFTLSPDGFGGAESRAAISPDGRYIAYITGSAPTSLWLHDLARGESRALPYTDGARRPFWSPDSGSIGYVTGRQLTRLDLRNDSSVRICALTAESSPFVATWSPDGETIAFRNATGQDLLQVAAAGGEPEPLITRETVGGRFLGNPHFLPTSDGRQMLVYSAGSPGQGDLIVYDVERGKSADLGIRGSWPAYSPSGHLLYLGSSNQSVGALWAAPFDLNEARVTGAPFIVEENVGWPNVSSDGVLVYRHDPYDAGKELVWKDRAGETTERIPIDLVDPNTPRLSPRGTPARLAFGARAAVGEYRDVYVYELDRGLVSRLTINEGSSNWRPAWSPDGRSVAYWVNKSVGGDIYTKVVGESNEPIVLLRNEETKVPTDWSPDGRQIVYYRLTRDGDGDLMRLELDEAGRPGEIHELVATPADERRGTVSPDGNWIVYGSDQSGRPEIYLRRFPEGGLEYKISVDGGNQPRWRRDGTEVFYVEGDTLIAAPIGLGETPSFGVPEPLFSDPGLVLTEPARFNYDVGWDGESFVICAFKEFSSVPTVIRIVENGYEGFRDRK